MLAGEQARRGGHVHIGLRRHGINLKLLPPTGVTIHDLGDYKGLDPRLMSRIYSLIRLIRPNVVQTWMPQMDVVGGVAAILQSVPWLISERASEKAYERFQLQNWIRCRLARFAKAIAANSRCGKTYWRDVLNANFPVFEIANAVDVSAIGTISEKNPTVPDLEENKILVVGRLSPEKGLDVVIEAIRIIDKKWNIHVSIIGDGPLRPKLESHVRSVGLDDRISVLPYMAGWWELLKSARALVSMSRYEGRPNVILESMASGCPLIVSDIPAHREFLNEESAILVPSDNAAALAVAINSLLSEPAGARQRATRALRYVKGLTIQETADAYEHVYEQVMGCGKA